MKKVISILLALIIFCVGLPMTAIASDSETGTDEVILHADPLNAGEAGANVTADGSVFDVFVAENDEDGAYYTSTWDIGGIWPRDVVYNKLIKFNSGLTSEKLSWLGDAATLSALGGYITLNVDYRINATGYHWQYLNKNWGVDPAIYFGATNGQYYAKEDRSILGGSWNTLNIPLSADHLANDILSSGKFFFRMDPYMGSEPVTFVIDIRNIKITFNSADKDDINTALKAAGSKWTYDSLVSGELPPPPVDEVIFYADPLKAGEVGDKVSVGKIGNYSNEVETYVASDENGAYYTYSTETIGSGSGAYNWNYNNYTFFKTGIDAKKLPWLGDSKTIAALSGYVTFSYDYQIIRGDSGLKRYILDYLGLTSSDALRNQAPYLELNQGTAPWQASWAVDTGWQTATNVPVFDETTTFADGLIGIKQRTGTAWGNSSLTVNLRNIKMTISSADKDAINEALAAAGSEWTYDSLISGLGKALAKDDVIFAANPLQAGEVGDKVTVGKIGNYGNEVDTYVASDENGDYYTYSTETIGSGSGAYNWNYNNYTFFKTGLDAEKLPWLGDSKTIAALSGYVTFSYDYQIIRGDSGLKRYILDYLGLTSSDALRNQAPYLELNHGTDPWQANWAVDTGWQTATNVPVFDETTTFADGLIGIKQRTGTAWGNSSLTVNLRNIKMTISSADKDAINEALAKAGSEWTYDTLVKSYAKAAKIKYVRSEGYNIWEADPQLQEEMESIEIADVKPNATVSQKNYSGSIQVDLDEADEYIYSARIDTQGTKGGDQYGQVFVTPINNNTKNYGWMSDVNVWNAIAPYAHFKFSYRVPDNNDVIGTDIYFDLASDSAFRFKNVTVSRITATQKWIDVDVTLGSFTAAWWNTYIHFNVYRNSALPNTVLLEFSDIRIELLSTDRDAINEALAKAGSMLTFDDLTSNASNSKAVNTVWYASADRASAKNNDILNNDLSANGAAAEKVVDATANYNVTVPVAGNGGSDYRAVVKSGITPTDKGFGWIKNNQYLGMIKDYLYVSFDYRTGSDIPADTKLALSAAGAKTSTLLGTTNIRKDSEWSTHYGLIEATSIGDEWNGDLEVVLTSETGFASAVNVELRNVKLAIRDYDFDNINCMFVYSSSFVGSIENFGKGLDMDRLNYSPAFVTETSKDYYDVFDHMLLAIPDTEFDANDDDAVDILDLVRAKKILVGSMSATDVILPRLDTDSSRSLNSVDITEMRKFILTDDTVVYNEPIIVELVQDHPGVVNMDAQYQLVLTDRATGNKINSGYSVVTDNSAVTVSGLTLTVPYSVRSSSEKLTVTVTSGSKIGHYTFDFQKFSAEAVIKDDFSTKNEELWTGWETSAEIVDGNLKFTGTADGGSGQIISTVKQAYGSFSARIKMPAKGVLANCAFWLRTDGTYSSYVANPLNPAQQGGEIDIVEFYPTWNNRWSSSMHWNGWSSCHLKSAVDNLPGTNLQSNYHVYSAVWTPYGVYSYLDGVLCRSYEGSGLSDNSDGMQVILAMITSTEDNSWGGKYDASKFPGYMYTDWVEVYALAD